MASHYEVKIATFEEFAKVVEFAQHEKWNFTREDLAIWMKCEPPESFFVATKKGAVVGGIMYLIKSNGFGYVSFFMVKQEERGRGAGMLLFQKAMENRDDYNSVLISAPKMTKKYRDSFGFHVAEKLQVLDVRGSNPSVPDSYRLYMSDLNFVAGDKIDAELINNYDRSIYPYDRSAYLHSWLRHPNGCSVVAVNGEGRPVGYGVLRVGPISAELSPLLADTADVAKGIVAKLTELMRLQVVRHGLSARFRSDNTEMRQIADELGLQQFAFANIQYKSTPAEYDAKRIFAFSEFGYNYA